jgi:YD repeat-containing protein
VTTYNHDDPAHPGDLTSMVDADGKTWTYGYDAYGNATSATDPLGDSTTSTFNALDWILTRTAPRENVAGCTCAGRYTTTYSYAYPGGGTDQYGDPQAITGPPGPNHVVRTTTMTYDADRNLRTLVDADNHPATATTPPMS